MAFLERPERNPLESTATISYGFISVSTNRRVFDVAFTSSTARDLLRLTLVLYDALLRLRAELVGPLVRTSD